MDQALFTYRREIPYLDDEYDVVVAGGGPAGITAAVSASRMGQRVLLIERYGVIGGNLTVGHICPILGSVSSGTMYDELVALLSEGHEKKETHVTRNGKEIDIDPEEAKARLVGWLDENHVTYYLLTKAVDVIKEGNSVVGLVLSAPNGIFAVRAKVVIDATGDGEVAFLAGAEYAIGRDDGATQPISIEFLIDHVDETVGITAWGGSDPVKLPSGQEYRELCKEKEREGILPKNVSIVRLHRTFHPGERSVNATQVNGLSPLDPKDLARAESVLRAQIPVIFDFLRTYVPGYEKIRLKSSAWAPGVRESRRILGDYILCDRDVETGAEYDDAIVHKAWFLIDIHNPKGGGQAEGRSQPAIPYDIPYRCFLPRGVDNLLTAGRCISGTHRAHASYRVMAVCMAMGEAVGVAASLAVSGGMTPREVSAKKVREVLSSRGVEL